MMNHALSLANHTPYLVEMIGYRGNSLPESIKQNRSIKVRYLSTKIIDKLKNLPKILYLFYALIRIILQILQLSFVLLSDRYQYILIQNPPCVPLFLVCGIVRKLRCGKTQVIIDWHNYAYTILRVNRVNKLVLFFAKIYEMKLGKLIGDHHLCVSKAMQADLINQFGIRNPIVLYDAATAKFQELRQKGGAQGMNMKQKHELFKKLEFNFEEQKENGDELTTYTHFSWKDNTYKYRQNRPVLCLSSTSYTPDEDFNVLIESLDILENKLEADSTGQMKKKFPKLQFIVTGKGPLKPYYLNIFEEKNKIWTNINISTIWLEVDDYPKMVACADLGVCLHFSSSSLDLPMKVVDMFSANLPCLAYNYKCIGELVEDKVNGRTFNTSQQLADQLEETLSGFDCLKEEGGTSSLQLYKKNLQQNFSKEDWETRWKNAMRNIILVSE